MSTGSIGIKSSEKVNNNKLGVNEIFAYFSYGFGQCISFGLFGSFILFFYTDVMKISAVAASSIFFIARVWDAINDPMAASIIDIRPATKDGKFRQYLKWMPFFIVIITILGFWDMGFSNTSKVIYAGVTYILWGMFYTVSDVPFWSLSTVMTNDSHERVKAITYANLGVFAGIAFPMVAFEPLRRTVSGFVSGATPSIQFLFAVTILMFIGLGFMRYGYKNTVERVKHKKSDEKISVKDIFKVLSINKPLFIILIAYFFNIFTNIASALAIYFFKYNMNNVDLLSVFGFIGLGSALGFFIIPTLTKYISKKKLLMTILFLEAAFRSLLYLNGYESTTSFLVLLTVSFVLYSAAGPLLSSMIADTVTYAEWKTGKRFEAITFSGQTFAGKLSVALSGTLAAVILTFINYKADATQLPETLEGLFFVFALLPALGALLRLVLISFYKFTEDKYEVALEEIEKRKL